MSMDEIIKRKVRQGLAPQHMELVNESRRHAGHAGDDGSGETHYKLMVVSLRFANLSRVERQRMVYSILQNEFENGIHALNIKALTPEEYQKI